MRRGQINALRVTITAGFCMDCGRNTIGAFHLIAELVSAHRPEGRWCMEHEEVGTRPTRDGSQAVRSNLGLPSSVIRLRIRTPILTSAV